MDPDLELREREKEGQFSCLQAPPLDLPLQRVEMCTVKDYIFSFQCFNYFYLMTPISASLNLFSINFGRDFLL